MNQSSFRRLVVPTMAALASLVTSPLRAEPVVPDADLNAAVHAMRALAKHVGGCPGIEQLPPSASAADWQTIMDAAHKLGTFVPPSANYPTIIRLEDHIGDEKGDHWVQKFEVGGDMIVPDGQQAPVFQRKMVMITSAHWKLAADKHWDVETWIYKADPYGHLLEPNHGIRLVDANLVEGEFKDIVDPPADADRIVRAKYAELIAYWSKARQ